MKTSTAALALPGQRLRCLVKIRRSLWHVRPEAEQIDGREFFFSYGWLMGNDDPYPGEVAMLPVGSEWPANTHSY